MGDNYCGRNTDCYGCAADIQNHTSNEQHYGLPSNSWRPWGQENYVYWGRDGSQRGFSDEHTSINVSELHKRRYQMGREFHVHLHCNKYVETYVFGSLGMIIKASASWQMILKIQRPEIRDACFGVVN